MGPGLLTAAAGLIRLIRYRFLLFAGLLPFGLGQVIAWHEGHPFDGSTFAVALAGLVFVLIGVESFNEYFDSRIGTDRVFSLEREEVPTRTFFLGLGSFAAAAAVMALLTWKLGWPVAAFSAVGAMAACFYVMPPVTLAYRGLGEAAIAISYGPMMTAGSFFVQAHRVDATPFVAGVVPALLILCVAVINEVPDYFGDRIVGKRNIAVRLGRRGAIWFSGAVSAACFAFLIVAAVAGLIPRACLLALLALPLAVRGFSISRRHLDDPKAFIPAIRSAIVVYSLAVILMGIGFALPAEWSMGTIESGVY